MGEGKLRILLWILLLCSTAWGQTFERPFTSNSIWNMPIEDGATYVNAGYSASNDHWFVPDQQIIKKSLASDPSVEMRQKTGAGFDFDYCNAAKQSSTVIWSSFRIANSYVNTSNTSGNGQGLFVLTDDATV